MNTSLSRSLLQTTLFSVALMCSVSTSHALEAQSPIDINSRNSDFGELPPLQFTLSSDTALTVINNGSPDPEKPRGKSQCRSRRGISDIIRPRLELGSIPLSCTLEHLLNGQASPMEMHLVFGNDDDLLVVGRWVKEGAFNSALDPIFSHVPQNTDETLHVDHFNLDTLLPDNLASFRYSGALTTPPFSEGVSRVQLAKPLYMSHDQISAFSSMFPEGDARDVQALNGRIIATDLAVSLHQLQSPKAI